MVGKTNQKFTIQCHSLSYTIVGRPRMLCNYIKNWPTLLDGDRSRVRSGTESRVSPHRYPAGPDRASRPYDLYGLLPPKPTPLGSSPDPVSGFESSEGLALRA